MYFSTFDNCKETSTTLICLVMKKVFYYHSMFWLGYNKIPQLIYELHKSVKTFLIITNYNVLKKPCIGR